MDSSIVIRELYGDNKVYYFKISGILYTSDIVALGREIKSKLKSENDITEVQVDIGDIEPSLFYKSNRFLGLCTHLSNEYKDTRFKVIINERLSESFPEFDLDQTFDLSKINSKIATVVNNDLGLKNKLNFFIIPNKSKRDILIYITCIILSFVCFQKTVFGYALFLTCGTLLIESLLYLRVYNRNRKSESVMDDEESRDFEFTLDNDEIPVELLNYKCLCEK